MSSILFIAPLLAFIVSLFIWGMFRAVGRRYGKSGSSRASGCAVAAIAFPVLTVLLFMWLPKATTYSGKGVTAQAANNGLLTISVPEAATDVDFRHSYFSGRIDEADFTIDETAFLAWARENEWTVAEFYTDGDGLHWQDNDDPKMLDQIWVTPVANVIEGRHDDLEVHNGYYFDDYEKDGFDDSGLVVVYDKERGRAHVWRTTY